MIRPDAIRSLEDQKSPGLPFHEIWVVDFEFVAEGGNTPAPVCMVAKEINSQRTIRLWCDELLALDRAPFDTSRNALFVAYFASAELGCFNALGWRHPERLLDLFAEFRAETNGRRTLAGNSLIGALQHYGLSAVAAEEKDDMRALIMGGGPWNAQERDAILEYCQSDVVSTEQLLNAMLDCIAVTNQRLGWALLRGRYMAAVAWMETNGTAIDIETLGRLLAQWDEIKTRLISAVDADFGVYEGPTFKQDRFERFLAENDIAWPRLESGALSLDDQTFRQQAKLYPKIAPLRQLRQTLGQLRLNELSVGDDGRNRTLLSPLRSKTGRNQPSNSKFIFGAPAWLRGLIKPPPGHGLAYLDWKSQEIAIAAALSGDENLRAAYETGDPYMSFAIQAGLAPNGATKQSHEDVRNRCKAIVLGVQYGMSAKSIAHNSGLHVAEARELLLRHKETFHIFWEWANQNVQTALIGQTLFSRYGWPLHVDVGTKLNDRSFLNWPMQANGAEMMRFACMMATEAGLKLCAPIHDGLLLEVPIDKLEQQIDQLKAIMTEASELVLGDGFVCGVDVEVTKYPERFIDRRGIGMWERVTKLAEELEAACA